MIGAATEPELRRMAFRLALFARRGIDDSLAGRLTDRLRTRDTERDDRRLCIECAHCSCAFEPSGPCLRCAKQGPVMRTQLQRCPMFAWERPAHGQT